MRYFVSSCILRLENSELRTQISALGLMRFTSRTIYNNNSNFYNNNNFSIPSVLLNNDYTDRFLLHGYLIQIIRTTLDIWPYRNRYSINQNFIFKKWHPFCKLIGRRRYWRYKYSDLKNINFDQFIIRISQVKLSEFHLCELDNRCILLRRIII
jgi:hypothetical protein